MSKKPCVHHWLIKPAHGPTSEGVCCRCGRRRDFRNSRPDRRWLSKKERASLYRLLGYVPQVEDAVKHPWRRGE